MSKSDLTENQIRDFNKYFVRNPTEDVDYIAKYNKAKVEETIRKYEANRAAKIKAHNEAIGERVDAAMYYIKELERQAVDNDPGGHIADKYFGRKVRAQLRAQQIIEELKEQDGKLIRVVKTF